MGAKADLLKAALEVVEKRGLTYGQAENNFKRIADLWDVYLAQRVLPAGPYIREVDVAAMMSLMKIARLMEKPDHYDSWLDLAGYAACGGEVSGSRDNVGRQVEPNALNSSRPIVTNTPRAPADYRDAKEPADFKKAME